MRAKDRAQILDARRQLDQRRRRAKLRFHESLAEDVDSRGYACEFIAQTAEIFAQAAEIFAQAAEVLPQEVEPPVGLLHLVADRGQDGDGGVARIHESHCTWHAVRWPAEAPGERFSLTLTRRPAPTRLAAAPPMIRLLHSNRFGPLVDALVADLERAKARPGFSPLDPVEVVVRHRVEASYLKLEIARRSGIAANLRFDPLAVFLARVVADGRGRGLRLAGQEALESAILSVLFDSELLEEVDLALVRRYLAAAGGDADAADLRRVQLARELAHLFSAYLLERRDMTKAWPERTVLDAASPALAEVERFERAVWNRIFGAGGPLDRHRSPQAGGPILTLVEALETIPIDALALPPAVHLFGLPALSSAMQVILSRIAQRADVHIYAENPCKEFWDDVDQPGESPPLRLWGRAGRERLRLLQELVEWDFDARWADLDDRSHGPGALLARLQQDILIRRPERATPDAPDAPGSPADRSLVLLACPSIRREAEVIAGEIWSLISRSEASPPGRSSPEPGATAIEPPLRFNQIAVVLGGGDHDAYRTHLAAVLAETFDIPHHAIDVPVRSSSRVVEAIELLLALPFSSFGRPDLLRLLLHPLVAPHIGGVAGVDTSEWIRWLDALTAVHGADHADHLGTYIEKDLYNWDQALKRLVLGVFLSAQNSGEVRSFPIGQDQYLPYESPSDRLGTVARLIVIVRSLIADARFARRSTLSLAEWADFIGAMIGAYLIKETEQDERDVHRCLQVIHDLEKLDAGPVSFRIGSEIVRNALQGLLANQGQPLADAVVIGPLAALASLPFRVVFMTGLGEGQFPAPEPKSQLDLRNAGRRRGDVTRREAEELQFLERILATEEHLYLSYVSRETRTGDALEPSSVVLELLQILEREYVGAEGVKALTEHHPLRRYDEPCFETNQIGFVPDAAIGERRSVELRDHLFRTVPEISLASIGALDLGAFRSALSPERHEALARHLGAPSIPEPAPRAGGQVIPVQATALRSFLEDPKKGWKRLVLGLRENDLDGDPLARENEAFSTSALDASILLRSVLAEKLRREPEGDGFEPLYDRRARLLELEGTIPTGVFQNAERFKHLAILEAWYLGLVRLHGSALELIEGVRFGRARESAPVKGLRDPLVLELTLGEAGEAGGDEPGRRVRIELSGQTDALIAPSSSWTAMARDEPVSESEKSLLALRGFFDHLMLAALGLSERPGTGQETEHRALVLFSSAAPYEERFGRFERQEAIEYLRVLCIDLLSRPHAYDLPFSAVLEAARDPGQIPRHARASGLSEVEIEEILRRRFGPYFAKRRLAERG